MDERAPKFPLETAAGSSRQHAQSFCGDMARRIATMLDLAPQAWDPGNSVPFGWHFALFGGETRRAGLRSDGFPGLGIAMPPELGNRLVALGRIVKMPGRIMVEQKLQRSSRIARIVTKRSEDGPVQIVTVEHLVRDAIQEVLLLEEQQTYLCTNRGFAPPVDDAAVEACDVVSAVIPDETMLFQFSALAFNSHKIHLDRHYAQSEGYPDIVVNGGLITLLMTEIARQRLSAPIRQLQLRNRSPAFCNRMIRFAVDDYPAGCSITALDDSNRVVATMEISTDEL
ncbi:hypothetical protein [Blastomonas sp. RAC04]|uniref:hypothetical protein n=1 Tax=Blastomonas sp. RAC04 TaxID=1842535 RepID=UPI0012372C47|nr:hypothetical protein [Blastomonas sp. RAC04]